MVQSLATRLIVLGAAAALAACTSGVPLESTSNLSRAGGPANSGGVCAYYGGSTSSGRIGPNETFRRRACFPTAAACRAWLFQVQSRFPNTFLRKGCGS